MEFFFLTISVTNYIIFALDITRDLEFRLLLFWVIAFFSFLFYFQKTRLENFSLQKVLILALALRLTLFLMLPNLSDDFFRFIWDGHLILRGENPYAYIPAEHPLALVKPSYWFNEVYQGQMGHFPQGMNSKYYFSVYPPVKQLIFAIATFLAGKNLLANIIFLRLMVITFDIGLIFLMAKIANGKNLQRIGLYAFNPLVIVELTGNLHFEGVALFFVFLALLFFKKHSFIFSGIFYALAILVKLVPFLLVGVFFFRLSKKERFFFYGAIFCVVVLFFLPFWRIDLKNSLGESLLLYFQKFEFNASIYYILRELGYLVTGYNTIAFWGRVLPIIFCMGTLIILWFSKRKMDFEDIFLPIVLILFLYYVLASIVHPWYIIYLLAFSVFTQFSFPLVWSGIVFLSYWAYRDVGMVNENLWLTIFSYAVVFFFFFYDWKKLKLISKMN